MDLILSDIHPYNASYFNAAQEQQGLPVFIAKSGRFTGRRNITIEHPIEGTGAPFAQVEIHYSLFGNSDTVVVRGRQIQILGHKLGWKSVEFIAVDGRVYKWKLDSVFGRDMHLEVQGQEVAKLDGGSRHLFSDNEPPILRVYPEGLPVLEDIVTALAYVTKRREMSKEASRAAAS